MRFQCCFRAACVIFRVEKQLQQECKISKDLKVKQLHCDFKCIHRIGNML